MLKRQRKNDLPMRKNRKQNLKLREKRAPLKEKNRMISSKPNGKRLMLKDLLRKINLLKRKKTGLKNTLKNFLNQDINLIDPEFMYWVCIGLLILNLKP